MQTPVTASEILSIYTFDPAFFFGGAVAFLSIGLVSLIILAIIVPFVVRARAKSDAIGAFLVKKGAVAVFVLSIAAGYFYQSYQRKAFANVLSKVPPAVGVTDISNPDIHGNITMNIGADSYRVPSSVAFGLRDKVFKPRNIVFDIPAAIQKEP